MKTISIYMKDGRVFEYEVADASKGREHAYGIISSGYRHTSIDSQDLEWYTPSSILKVKVIGGAESSQYRDTARAT